MFECHLPKCYCIWPLPAVDSMLFDMSNDLNFNLRFVFRTVASSIYEMSLGSLRWQLLYSNDNVHKINSKKEHATKVTSFNLTDDKRKDVKKYDAKWLKVWVIANSLEWRGCHYIMTWVCPVIYSGGSRAQPGEAPSVLAQWQGRFPRFPSPVAYLFWVFPVRFYTACLLNFKWNVTKKKEIAVMSDTIGVKTDIFVTKARILYFNEFVINCKCLQDI